MSDWMEHARCREIGPEIFFPDPMFATASYREARKVCAICPVRQPCRDDALAAEATSERGARGGMWGGLTPDERHALTNGRQTAA